MRAIVLEKFGGLDSLVYKDIPEPEPKAGQVVIQIKAFGLIPVPIDQNPCAHWRSPMDMMHQG